LSETKNWRKPKETTSEKKTGHINKRDEIMNNKKRNSKIYISSVLLIIVLFSTVLWLGSNYYYIPMKQAEGITKLIEERTLPSLRKAEELLMGWEMVRGRRQIKDDHKPLPKRYAKRVKKETVHILSTTDNIEILWRTLSLLISATWEPERSGIVIEDEKDWVTIEKAINKYNQNKHTINRSVRYFISVDSEGKRAIGIAGSAH